MLTSTLVPSFQVLSASPVRLLCDVCAGVTSIFSIGLLETHLLRRSWSPLREWGLSDRRSRRVLWVNQGDQEVVGVSVGSRVPQTLVIDVRRGTIIVPFQ